MLINRTTLIILCVVFFTSCSQPISYKRTQNLLDFKGSGCNTAHLLKKNYKNIWADHNRNDLEHIEMFLNETGSPALIKDPSDFDSIYVVMPMKG